MIKQCPFKFSELHHHRDGAWDSEAWDCQEEKCAWWDEAAQKCAVLTMTTHLATISDVARIFERAR